MYYIIILLYYALYKYKTLDIILIAKVNINTISVFECKLSSGYHNILYYIIVSPKIFKSLKTHRWETLIEIFLIFFSFCNRKVF